MKKSRSFKDLGLGFGFGLLLSLAAGRAEAAPPASCVSTHDVHVGSGASVVTGKTVQIWFESYLPDGSVFGSTDGLENRMVTVTLGERSIIRGLELGLIGMKPGGIRKLVVQPRCAYGEEGHWVGIPNNTTLRFIVRLIGYGATPAHVESGS